MNPTEEKIRPTYLVRAGSQSEGQLKVFFKGGRNDVVAVGWSEVNFSAYSDVDQLVEVVRNRYYLDNRTAAQIVGKKLNEVKRFQSIQIGDRIVVPYFNQVRLGVITSDTFYDDQVDKETIDMSNQRKAQYLMSNGDYVSILRTQFSGALQSRLRVRGTSVADLAEFAKEIDEFFKNPQRRWDAHFTEAEKNYAIKWQQRIARSISEGKAYLEAGGLGLENLVRYLLELDGYKATLLSKRKFKELADADIKATRSDRCSETNLYVQVKHHQGESNSWGAEQLTKIREVHGNDPEIADYEMVLVTSGNASLELKQLCEDQDIKLITGDDLAEWLYYHLDNINNEWRAKLGIAKTGELVY